MATASAPIRVLVIFHGRVQGVGFRATTAVLARSFPVSGFVRNEPDGAVHLEAQGLPAAVAGLLDRIHVHFNAQIADDQRTEIPTVDGEHGFEIRY